MDNFKIIYEILRELERNMGNEKFDIYQISAKRLKISYEKWEQLLILLSDRGCISGIVIVQNMEDRFRHIAEPLQPFITLKGLEYLANNTFMEKAKEELRLAGEIF